MSSILSLKEQLTPLNLTEITPPTASNLVTVHPLSPQQKLSSPPAQVISSPSHSQELSLPSLQSPDPKFYIDPIPPSASTSPINFHLRSRDILAQSIPPSTILSLGSNPILQTKGKGRGRPSFLSFA